MTGVFRDDLFKGKTAFIAGGSSGINLRIAERFALLGAKVSILSRSREKIDAALAGINKDGADAIGFAADVRDYDAIANAVLQTADAFGPIDFVVSGAAGNFVAPALGMSANAFKTVIDIDLLGTFNVLKASFEHLRRPGASLINISATQAEQAVPLQSHVCSAKAGIGMLTKSLALEWGPSGVRVNAIMPGPVEDTEGMRRLGSTPEIRQSIERSIPLQRYASKDEIADLAIFLCSDASTYITGALLPCDGGSLAGQPYALLG